MITDDTNVMTMDLLHRLPEEFSRAEGKKGTTPAEEECQQPSWQWSMDVFMDSVQPVTGKTSC